MNFLINPAGLSAACGSRIRVQLKDRTIFDYPSDHNHDHHRHNYDYRYNHYYRYNYKYDHPNNYNHDDHHHHHNYNHNDHNRNPHPHQPHRPKLGLPRLPPRHPQPTHAPLPSPLHHRRQLHNHINLPHLLRLPKLHLRRHRILRRMLVRRLAARVLDPTGREQMQLCVQRGSDGKLWWVSGAVFV